MLVPDEIRKCVAFVCYKSKPESDQGELAGTAFYVLYPDPENPPSVFGYFVTANHVIKELTKRAADGNAYLRMNCKAGPAKLYETHCEDWFTHPSDRAADVAVLQLRVPLEADVLPYHLHASATKAVIGKERIGIGDEVFLTGLFVEHYGNERNAPILRVGNLAAMPEEPIYTSRGPMEAYLVEARSIGGLSGSPVFVHLGIVRKFGDQVMHSKGEYGTFYLLGLMHGHWDLVRERAARVVLDESTESVNMGIAIVVPVEKIVETIEQPALKEKRRKAIERERA